MIVTKKRLVKEAANALMALQDDSFFELASATFAINGFLIRLGINGNDLLAELLRRQQEEVVILPCEETK